MKFPFDWPHDDHLSYADSQTTKRVLENSKTIRRINPSMSTVAAAGTAPVS
jgi:hypothetical protein